MITKHHVFRTNNVFKAGISGHHQAASHECSCHQHDEDDEQPADDDYRPLGVLDVIASKLPKARRDALLANRQRDDERRAQGERLRAQGHTVANPLGRELPLSDEIAEAMLSPSLTEMLQSKGRAR